MRISIMSLNYNSARKAMQSSFLVLVHFSSLDVLLASTYSRSKPEVIFKVNRTPISGETDYENFKELDDDEYELGYYGIPDNQQTSDEHSEELLVNSLFLELLIFVCCAAGVFGICIFCCIICGQLFDSKQDGNRNQTGEENLTSYLNNRAVRIQRGEDETILTFISVHRNPWSPGVFDGEQDSSHFEYDDHTDMPPQYEDLDLSKKPEELYSPLPPPYTPSFRLVDEGEKCNFMDEKKHQDN